MKLTLDMLRKMRDVVNSMSHHRVQAADIGTDDRLNQVTFYFGTNARHAVVVVSDSCVVGVLFKVGDREAWEADLMCHAESIDIAIYAIAQFLTDGNIRERVDRLLVATK